MSNYIGIPVVAMGCYLFLFLAFLAAKKNKIINSFLVVLLVFLIWTIGSFFMRMQLYPGVNFWFNLSIIGLIMLPFAFFNFVHAFVGSREKLLWYVWLILGILNCIMNINSGFYIPCPDVVTLPNGTISYEYHLSWTIGILFVCAGITVIHMLCLVFSYSKKDSLASKQFQPIIIGIICLFMGHIATLFPVFKGFPTDVLSGIINAFFMFYALYKRRLFKLTLLVSRGVIYVTSVLISVLLFANLVRPMERFMRENLNGISQYSVLVIALLFTVATLLVSNILKKFIDGLFAKEELLQAEYMKEFSLAIAKSLEVNEIMEQLVTTIHKTIEVDKIFVCTADVAEKKFMILHSTSPLDGKSINLGLDNPAIKWLIQNNKCILMKEFQRSKYYKSMWDIEKKQLHDLKIECIAPLKDGEDLVGIILLSQKKRGRSYTYSDLNLLASINTISSIAIKNSRMYEKAFLEARTDELTGLLNRKYFYERLQLEFERCKGESLALAIINMDDFKLYNQLYGMKEGDEALKAIAKIIKASVGENGYVARYSGKEFAIILPNYDVLCAKKLVETIRLQIENMNRKDKEYVFKVLTFSGGISAIPYSASNVKELVENADMAVFHVKRGGKNAILIYEANVISSGETLNQVDKEAVYLGYAGTIYALTAAIDTKDHYTFNHSKQVAHYATELAKACGMNMDFVEIVREAGLLHDIGKIGIPEHVLNKPGRLTQEEYEIMKTHVEYSVGIIRNLPSLDYVIPAVIAHHERYDGKGYPRGIKGVDIPLSARILCIADAFDAMVSKRTYKEAYKVEYAIEEMTRQAGKQFDPELAGKFVELVRNHSITVEY
ncbi:HD domain-containing phosphohydrolase [Lachnospiraceae bacterium LCP25S3_G4]